MEQQDFENNILSQVEQSMPTYDFFDYIPQRHNTIPIIHKKEAPQEQKPFEIQTNLVQAEGRSNVASNTLMNSVNKFLGETYSNAKRLKPGFADCSGFTNKVFKDLGIDMKGATSIMMHQKLTDKVDLQNIQPGDLAFLTTTSTRNVAGTVRKPGTSSHVAIVLERQGTKVKVAECTPSGGSHIGWWEVGDASKRERGVVNYAKGSGRKNEILGFGRVRV